MGRSTHEIDWEGVERAYRLGSITIDKLAEKFSVNKTTIIRRAKKENWTRDLADEVRSTTKANVQRQIAEEAAKTQLGRHHKDATVVELNAISNSLLIAEHEKGATAGRELMVQIIGRAKAIIDDSPKSVSEALERAGDDDEYLAKELRKLVGLPVIVDVVGKAIAGHEKASNQERKARNLDDAPPPKDESAVETLLAEIKDRIAQ